MTVKIDGTNGIDTAQLRAPDGDPVAMTIDNAGKVAFPQGVKGPAEIAAFAVFSGMGAAGPITPQTQENIGSISKSSTGIYVLTFATPLADANYGVLISCQNAGPAFIGMFVSGNASSFTIGTYTFAPALADNGGISVLVVRTTP